MLGNFSEDAIKRAETVRYPTVLIEGETWAIATEVARAKGVSPGDIHDNMEFTNASSVKYGMPPDAIQRMLRHLGIEMWINLQKIGWQRCTPPN